MEALDTTWSVDTWRVYEDPETVRTVVVSNVDEETARATVQQIEATNPEALEIRLLHGDPDFPVHIVRWNLG